MPNPFRRLTSFFQDRVQGFTREINNTFSAVTGRRQTPLPEEAPSPIPEATPIEAAKPTGFPGFIKSIVTSPFAKEVSQTAAQKSATLTENAVFAGSMLVGHLLLGPVGAIGLGVGVNFLQNRNQGRRQTLGKTVVTAGSIGAGALAGAGIGAALGLPLGPIGVIVGSGLGSATGGLVARAYSHRVSASLTNIFTAAQAPLSPNNFVTITSNLTSIILAPITIPFNLFLKPLLVGCLILIALILSAIFLIFALFIIPNPQTTGSPTGPGSPKTSVIMPPRHLDVSGTCPIDGGIISTGSLGTNNGTLQHGSEDYAYGFQIPIGTMYPNCLPGSCPFYGWAADIVPPSGGKQAPVVVPRICTPTSCNDCTWTRQKSWRNCEGDDTQASTCPIDPDTNEPKQYWGYGIVLNSTCNGQNLRLYLNHIEPGGGSFQSSYNTGSNNVVGTLTQSLGNPHVHIELNIEGVPEQPDFLCL